MLKGKAAVVTGSTGGLGLGIARAFVAQGANLMLNGFGDPTAIEALKGSSVPNTTAQPTCRDPLTADRM